MTRKEPLNHKDTKTRSVRLIASIGIALLLIPSVPAGSNLLENSPFLPTDQAATVAQQAAPLELRSILMEGGQYEFSLYDSAKKQSTWIGLNEPGDGILVKTFDPTKNVVTVEHRSRTYTLALKEARISPMSPQFGGAVATATLPNQAQVTIGSAAVAAPNLDPHAESRKRFAQEVAMARKLANTTDSAAPSDQPQ